MSPADILLSPLTIRLTPSVIYRHAIDLRSMTLVIDCPANALRSMNVVIYYHASDLQEMTLVIYRPANALRLMNSVIDRHANDLR